MVKEGMDSLVSSIRPQHSEILRPRTYSFEILDHPSLFEPSLKTRSLFESVGDTANNVVSNYYESLVGAIVGCTHRRALVESQDGRSGYPDFIDVRNHTGTEVKAVVQGRTLDLRDNQIAYLADFQSTHRRYRLHFAVARYRTPNIPLQGMNSAELLDFLTKHATAYMILLPFSLAHHFFEAGEEKRVAHRYKGSKTWLPRIRLRSRVLDNLAFDSAQVIEQVGLNPDSYRTSRKKVFSQT